MSASKRKGTRVENYIKDLHVDSGVAAARVPLSGAAGAYTGGLLAGDVVVGTLEDPIFRGEVKARKNGTGFAMLEKWLGNNDLLFLRRDRAEPFVAMPWHVYIKLMKVYINGGEA